MNSNNTDRTGDKKKSQADNKSQDLVTRISETISFHQLIDSMDQNDKKLDPRNRKKKWILILCSVFFLYLASFFIFPRQALIHETIQPVSSEITDSSRTLKNKKSLSFEMPVDSFEIELKQEIHEKSPEKK